jgi:DNA polymerase, archaea type
MAKASMGRSDRDLVFGRNDDPGLVAVEHAPGPDADAMILFHRDGERVDRRELPFRPYVWMDGDLLNGFDGPRDLDRLSGGGPFGVLATFPTWKAMDKAVAWLKRKTRRSPGDAQAPYFRINDPVQQFLTATGRTFFKDLGFQGIRRLQLDIETDTEEGFEFSNPDREGDRILAIGMSDTTGWSALLDGTKLDESTLLQRMVESISARDPDVIEGHNIFAFDLDFIARRAARHGVPLAFGRDGREPVVRPGRFSAAERSIAYPRTDVFGRTVIDTYFLVQLYDMSHRELDGLGLKAVARHFGFSPDGRETIEGGEIGRVFRDDPARGLRYLADDLRETAALSARLSPIYVAQATMVPMSFQNVAARGNAAKIDALMLREYFARRSAPARPSPGRPFEGGATDVFETGVIRNVHHCDVRSLYPSLMLAGNIAPASDTEGVFLRLLDYLRSYRLAAKARMRESADASARSFEEAMQSAFKILINSFYGYLGFEMARFNDFDAAEAVTARGRGILQGMVEAIRAGGGRPVEMDTDGIYFVPPSGGDADMERFRDGVRASLPEGIELEFDETYEAMFSYRRKNYALLARDGGISITGAALRSRGLEPFLRDFIREFLDLVLHGREAEVDALRARYRRAIVRREWPIRKFARTERLQDAPETYAEKRKAGGRSRNAAYELALASGRPYRAGDSISYYVTGERKSVAIHANSRRVAEWDPDRRDENAEYYAAKLEDLSARLKTVGGEDETETGGEPPARRIRAGRGMSKSTEDE